MMLFSTNYQPDHWMFKMKPETTVHTVLFYFVIGFFGGLSSVAGHELVHHKHWIHKIGGSIPYSTFLYSHFLDEHCRGHHKYIAKDEDPVSHAIGTSSYEAILKAAIFTHTKTWEREIIRLTKLGVENPFILVLKNRMTHYFVLHVSMCYAIF